jgi:hypothetical protein
MANWRDPNDPVARVVRRVFAFANDHSPGPEGYQLTVDGQEPFSVIQYNPGQEYRPHCDGSCDGSPHLHAGRVATMLMYCKVRSNVENRSIFQARVLRNLVSCCCGFKCVFLGNVGGGCGWRHIVHEGRRARATEARPGCFLLVQGRKRHHGYRAHRAQWVPSA